MIHSILDAVMAVLWIASVAACYVIAVLSRPSSNADGENKTGKNGDLQNTCPAAEPGELGEARPTEEAEGGADED